MNPHATSDPSPTPRPTSRSARIVRGLNVLLGLSLVVYAVSDHPLYGGGPGFGASQAAILALGVAIASFGLLPLHWNRRLLLMGVSGLFALASAEILAEFLLAPRFRTPYQLDDRLIFKLTPNRTVVSQLDALNGGGRVVQHINSDGFRGDELQPLGDSLRVVVYGDSFIHAYYTELEQTFCRQLDRLLEETLGTAVEVINAGVSSYGPDQISLKLEDELNRLEPDLILVAVFAGNDYGDLLRNKVFKIDDQGLLQENDYVLAPEVAQKFAMAGRGSVLKRALREFIGRRDDSFQNKLLGADDPFEAWLEHCVRESQREYEDYIVDESDVVTNTHVDHFSGDVSVDPNSISAGYKVQLMEAILQRIQTTAHAKQVPLAFLFIPHPLDACGEYLDGRIDASRYPEYDLRNMIGPLEEMATRMDAHYVSLLDHFQNNDAKQLYLRGADDHWNAAGQLLAAELMVDYITTHGLLKR